MKLRLTYSHKGYNSPSKLVFLKMWPDSNSTRYFQWVKFFKVSRFRLNLKLTEKENNENNLKYTIFKVQDPESYILPSIPHMHKYMIQHYL